MSYEKNAGVALSRRASVHWIMVIYFASGACSLIDEVVWVRLLKLILGNTVYATSIVVSVFMAGLSLGALLMGRYSDGIAKRLRLYAVLETLVTISAIALPFAFKLVDHIYVWFYRTYHPTHTLLLLVQVVISTCILLVPSMLMGATLPLLSRFVTGLERQAGHLVGRLYALNTLGAAGGCFLAGFVLIRAVGVMGALYTAAGLNLLVAFGGWLLSRFSVVSDEAEIDVPVVAAPGAERRIDGRFCLLVAGLFLSGLISIGYELVWMRSIVHLLGGYTYVFSAVLTVYLIGNVIGAGIGSGLVNELRRPALGFSVTLFLLGSFGVFYLPILLFWTLKGMRYIDLQIGFLNWLVPFSVFLAKPIVHSTCLFLVPSIIMGIGFPIALQAYANRMHKVGISTGMAYGANTIGAVVGGIATGFVLIPFLGVQLSVTVLGLLGVWLSAVMWAVFFVGGRLLLRSAVMALAVVVSIIAFAMPADLFLKVVARIKDRPGLELVAVKEGLTTTVSVHRDSENGDLVLYSSGQSIAGDNTTARGDQKMMGHLGVLLDSGTRRVLTVGFGSGETTACLSLHRLDAVDCVEIAPEVVDVSLKYFRHINLGSRLNKAVNMIYMDAKNYLHLTDSKYDVIVNDSIHPRVFAENASLYTKEYFENAKEHLGENGLCVSWIPIYQMPVSVVRSIIGTVMDVFEHTTVWYLVPNPAPLILVIGSQQQQYYQPAYIESKLADKKITANLAAINIYNSRDVLSCYVGDENDLQDAVAGYRLNSDYRPFIEFTTDEDAKQSEIFGRFILGVRSKSLYKHLDFGGLSDEQRVQWLSSYERFYKAMGKTLNNSGWLKKPTRLEQLE